MKDDVFAVIADSTRRHILQALAVERLAVGELVEELGVSQPTVSKHLKVLRTAGLVETEAVGQKRFYSITPDPLRAVTDWAQALLDAPDLHPGEQEEHLASQGKPADSVNPQKSETAPISPEKKASQVSAPGVPEDSEEESPMTIEATSEHIDVPVVPHPTNAGILITPLTPFTPVFDQQVVESAGEIIDTDQVFLGHQAESTQALSVALGAVTTAESVETEAKLQLKAMAKNLKLDSADEPAPTAEEIVSGDDFSQPHPSATGAEPGIDAQAEAAVAESQERASVTEAQAREAAEERGLLSKLARWSRRSTR